jgi:phage tail-like protein
MKRKILFAIFGALFFILGTSTLSMAPAGGKPDPLPSSNFIVEIDGLTSAGYMSVEGIGSEVEVVEYRDGIDPNRVRLLPGLARYGPVTLKRGLSEDTELWDWYETNLEAPVERKSMSVVFMDHGHEEKARYNLHDCWVSDYYIEPLSSSPSDVAVEVVVIQTELIERA